MKNRKHIRWENPEKGFKPYTIYTNKNIEELDKLMKRIDLKNIRYIKTI